MAHRSRLFSVLFSLAMPLCLCQNVFVGAQEKVPATAPSGLKPIATAAEAIQSLKSDEGSWEAAVTLWVSPGAAPIKTRATVNAKMELGGNYLEQRFDGKFGPEMGNKDWTSLSYTNFDASSGSFEAVRMASSGTPMIVVRGKAVRSEKGDLSMELKGEYQLMGMKATERDVITHEGPDRCTIESWMSFGGSEEFKGAEFVLTRVKRTMRPEATPTPSDKKMRLGNFSVSLAVKDLNASRSFYEKLGFSAIGGNAKNFLILQNDASTIGIFQGMLEKNILTFNPGWDRNTQTLSAFDDVRDIQQRLQAQGVALTTTADPASTGPASLTLVDPDGNQILVDQHVPKPKK